MVLAQSLSGFTSPLGEKSPVLTVTVAAALGSTASVCTCSYWWFTATGSTQRQRVNFAIDGILVGPLLGKAVTVIKNQPAAGMVSVLTDAGCFAWTPQKVSLAFAAE
jgi:hypothetical protein